ncbi:hypothetical protein ACLOJK_027226 [Asimina triloba]
MAEKMGMIVPNDLAFLRSRYCIPNCVELLARLEGETLQDHPPTQLQGGPDLGFTQFLEDHSVSIVVLKVMLGCITFIRKWNMKIVLNLTDSVPEWKLQFFYARFEEAEDLPLPGVPTASPLGGPEGRLYGEASGPSLGTHSSIEGSPSLVLRRPSYKAQLEEHPKKMKRLEEEDLQASLALSRKEAHRSGLFVTLPEASVDPTSLGSTLSPVLVVDIGANTTSPILILEFETFDAPGQEDVKELQRHRGPCRSVMRTRELSELEDRVCLIDWCASRAKYHYHVLGKHAHLPMRRSHEQDRFKMNSIMDEVERRKIIAKVKCPKEVGIEQASQEVLSFIQGSWHDGREARDERERCQVEGMTDGERHFFFQLLEMGRRVNRVEALREEAEGAILEFCSVFNATRAELDKARDDPEGISLAKQDLERALASLLHLSNQAENVREEASRLSSEIEAICSRGVNPDTNEESSHAGHEAIREEVSVLPEQVTVLSSRKSELLDESEIVRANVARLQTELETSRADLDAFKRPHPKGISLKPLLQEAFTSNGRRRMLKTITALLTANIPLPLGKQKLGTHLNLNERREPPSQWGHRKNAPRCRCATT